MAIIVVLCIADRLTYIITGGINVVGILFYCFYKRPTCTNVFSSYREVPAEASGDVGLHVEAAVMS